VLVITYNFVPNFFQKRAQFRSEHLNHLANYQKNGLIAAGGAFSGLPERGIILFRGSFEKAREFVSSDPFYFNKLVTDCRIDEWTVVAGDLKQEILEPVDEQS
jgi:uncharacterized protein YciI